MAHQNLVAINSTFNTIGAMTSAQLWVESILPCCDLQIAHVSPGLITVDV